MECSINETNEILRKIFVNMAMDSGCGHIIKRGPNRYLCVDEFKIPNVYDREEHARLASLFFAYKK